MPRDRQLPAEPGADRKTGRESGAESRSSGRRPGAGRELELQLRPKAGSWGYSPGQRPGAGRELSWSPRKILAKSAQFGMQMDSPGVRICLDADIWIPKRRNLPF